MRTVAGAVARLPDATAAAPTGMVDWESFYNAFRQPDFIAGFEIQHRLGGGAFGEVYLARKRSIGKAYAIKFLKLEGEARDAAERELDQVRLFAAIDHPNLVTIEDMGVVQGVPFLVMGYAGDETLARRMKRGDLTRDAALAFFVQASRGVLALHDRRLAHFDLKPGNIFLKGEIARVGDYGLAKLLSDGRTTLSFGRGTPHYMAPEMLKSRADHRADIYSLGVILYESVAGRLPFSETGAPALPLRECDDPPAFPADFPSALRPIVECALRLDPDRRFAGVDEMLGAIGQSSRQGDSVVVPWASPASAGASAAGVPVAVAPDGQAASHGELRQAAHQLVRGAVAVAHGVWVGVTQPSKASGSPPASRPASLPAPPGARPGPSVDLPASSVGGTPQPGQPAGSSAAAAEGRGEVISLKTLDEPDESSRASTRPQLRPVRLDSPTWSGAGAGLALPAVGGTVPVPPRVAGGTSQSAAAIAVVGLEVMIAVVAGPLARTSGWLARGLRHVWEGTLALARRAVGTTRGVVRFLFGLFLLAMALGFVAASVALLREVLQSNGG